jgi:hypothetical protein
MPEVALAVAYGETPAPGPEPPAKILVAAVSSEQPLDPTRLSQALADALPPEQRPRLIRRVVEIAMTEGFRPMKTRLRDGGPGTVLQTLQLDDAREAYREVPQARR